jgi:hypothetical protein
VLAKDKQALFEKVKLAQKIKAIAK